ncbi:hypothetical protein [Chryseobacterium terrae]|uniref:Glycosyltransferase RgtA/B/C/D-like domain-containing protein n=1 Tax=Chryseobacterium terrae TaxID=3163299 RepID=A0ABW8Y1U1_9FLAO
MEFIKKNYHYLLFISAVFFLGNPSKFPADDGFFYPQIAYNVVHHGFMGFNDLYLTNGFHPLWMVFCIVAELINPLDKTFALNIIWLFQVLLILFGSILLEKTIFKESEIGKIFSISFYCLMFFGIGTLFLTEAHLAFFTIALLVFFISKKFENDFAFGLICSLVFLARLDHIFLIIPFGFLYWKFRGWSIKSLGFMLIGFSVLSLPYLVSNKLLFGYFVPISGRIKSSFPVIVDEIPFGILFKFCLITGFSYLLFLFTRKNIKQKQLKICLVIGCLLHFFYNILFQSQIGQWYFVSQFLLFGFFISDIFFSLKNQFLRKKLTMAISTAILGVFICFFGYMKLTTNISIMSNFFGSSSKFEEKQIDKMKEITENMESFLPSKSRVYIYDFPGKFAFYSDLNFIPADALVASPKFFNDINKMRFNDYLTKNKINYLLLPSKLAPNEQRIYFMGLDIKKEKDYHVFYIKNTMDKKIVDSLNEKELIHIKEFENPAKTWQNNYESVSIYKTQF